MTWVVVSGIVLICLVAEGFFAGSELALVACDKVRLRQRAAAGSRGARMAEHLLANPALLFSTTLLGTNLSTITASIVTTLYLIQQYGPAYSSFALLLAPIILIFAEILPKSIYQHYANVLVDRSAPGLLFFRTVLFPAVWVVRWVTESLLGGVQRASAGEPRITRDELKELLRAEETRRGDIRPIERTMIARVLRLAELKAKNVMVPIIEYETLPISATRDAAIGICDVQGSPIIPVFSHRVFNVVGILEAIDVLCAAPDRPVRDLMHKPFYVAETMRLHDVFRALRQRREGAAVVVNEYGGAVGLVTLEDIVEEVVGEIPDEFSQDELLIHPLGGRRFMVQARTEIEVVAAAVGMTVPKGDYETLSGLLLHVFGYIPHVGEEMVIEGWRYRIQQATERTIVSVELWPVGEPG